MLSVRLMKRLVAPIMLLLLSVGASSVGAAPTPMQPAPPTRILASAPLYQVAVDTVAAYYDAINDGSYGDAYSLLGYQLRSQQSYANFAAGFRFTDYDDVTILDATAGTNQAFVTVDIFAHQDDGSIQYYHGVYTVGYESGGLRILAARVS